MKIISSVLVACTLLLGAAPARADEDAEQRARSLFAKGVQHLEQGDFTVALERFSEAYTLLPNVKILLNIGTMLLQLGENAEAANSYDAYLRDSGANPLRKAEVEALLADLDTRVAKLRISLSGPGMRALVDGQPVAEHGAEVVFRVEPGIHTVAAEMDGAAGPNESLTLAAGEEWVVALTAPAQTRQPVAPKAPEAAGAPSGGTHGIVGGAVSADRDHASERRGLSHRGQLGGLARADIDGQGRGVAVALGVSYGLGDYAEVSLSGVFARDKGVEPGVTVYLLRGRLKPMLSLGVPFFFVDGVYPGAHSSAGLMWDPLPNLGIWAGAGVAIFPSVPNGYDSVVFVPSVAVQPRL